MKLMYIIAIFFLGCIENSERNNENEEEATLKFSKVSKASELPICNHKIEGALFYVKETSNLVYCEGDKYKTISDVNGLLVDTILILNTNNKSEATQIIKTDTHIFLKEIHDSDFVLANFQLKKSGNYSTYTKIYIPEGIVFNGTADTLKSILIEIVYRDTLKMVMGGFLIRAMPQAFDDYIYPNRVAEFSTTAQYVDYKFDANFKVIGDYFGKYDSYVSTDKTYYYLQILNTDIEDVLINGMPYKPSIEVNFIPEKK